MSESERVRMSAQVLNAAVCCNALVNCDVRVFIISSILFFVQFKSEKFSVKYVILEEVNLKFS